MSSDLPRSHWDLKRGPWSDEPRYYPPGQHPATARIRAELKAAQHLRSRLKDQEMNTSVVDELIAYCEGRLTDFEAAESEAKARVSAAFPRSERRTEN